MSENNKINEDELRILSTWWDKMKAWNLPEDLFAGAAPVAMRPIRLLLSDKDVDGEGALKMIELILAGGRRLWLFTDSDRWGYYFNFNRSKWMLDLADIYLINDAHVTVEETLSKLIPCFKEVTMPWSEWDRLDNDPGFRMTISGRFELDKASLRYYLKEESIPPLTDDSFLVDLLGEILTAWEEGAAYGIVEEECYMKYWKPQMMKLLKVYREGPKVTMGDWAEFGMLAVGALFGR